MATVENIDRVISELVREEIEQQVERVISESRDRVEAAIRKSVASTVLQLHRFYSVERMGDNLVITVKIDGHE